MFQEYFSMSTLLTWPLIGLVIFLVSFAAILFYVVFGLRSKGKVDRLAGLPLEGESVGTEVGADRRAH